MFTRFTTGIDWHVTIRSSTVGYERYALVCRVIVMIIRLFLDSRIRLKINIHDGLNLLARR